MNNVEDYFCDLFSIDTDTQSWGGKAVSLSLLAKHQFCVPKGFVISTEAYHSVYLCNQRKEAFFEVLYKWKNKYFSKTDTIALRSSASLENTVGCSASGVFETQMLGEETFAVALEKIWRSTHSQFSKAYFQLLGAGQNDVSMAVIVQKMEKRKYSAVIQSYDVIHNRRIFVVEYVDGEVDSVVAGKVNANLLYINPQDGTFEGYNVDERIFSRQVIIRIMKDVMKAEKIFGGYIEMEAQIDGEGITYLQARKLQ